MIGCKEHPHLQVKSLVSSQDRTPEKGPSSLLPFLPSHIQISFTSLLMILLSGGGRGRERAEEPSARQHIPLQEDTKQNHLGTMTKSVTVEKPWVCINYDCCYVLILNVILDMPGRRVREGEKGQEENSGRTVQWVYYKNLGRHKQYCLEDHIMVKCKGLGGPSPLLATHQCAAMAPRRLGTLANVLPCSLLPLRLDIPLSTHGRLPLALGKPSA